MELELLGKWADSKTGAEYICDDPGTSFSTKKIRKCSKKKNTTPHKDEGLAKGHQNQLKGPPLAKVTAI